MGLSEGNCDLSGLSDAPATSDARRVARKKNKGLGWRDSRHMTRIIRDHHMVVDVIHTFLGTIPSSHTIEEQQIHSWIFCTRPQAQNQLKNANCATPIKKSHASRLSLLQATLCHTLRLVHLGSVTGRFEGIAGGRQGLQVSAVLFMSLERC